MLINTPINNANQRRLPFIIMFAGLKVPFYTNRRVWKPSLSWKGYSAILHSKSFVVPWQRVAWSPSSVCGSNLCYRRRRVCVVHQANRHTMMAAWGCPIMGGSLSSTAEHVSEAQLSDSSIFLPEFFSFNCKISTKSLWQLLLLLNPPAL